jgi:hypothetical protein
MREPIQICRGFTDEQWKALRKRLIENDEEAWRCAVDVFERRIRERFLSCIEALAEADSRSDVEVPAEAPADCSTLPEDNAGRVVVPGFAIMALCCLLIETLQRFREAPERPAQVVGPCAYPAGPCIREGSFISTTELFAGFLRLPSFKGEFEDDRVAKSFVRGVRNGILHDAETRRWVIWRDEPEGRIVRPLRDGYALNRSEFYKALNTELGKYLQELRNSASQERRNRFREKMDDVIKKV